MRSVIFRYEDIASLADVLSEARGALALPEGENVADGEWVLAIFEIGSRRRATAAAARGVRAAGDTYLAFERRDWERLASFVAARSEHMRAARPAGPTSSGRIPVAAENGPLSSDAARRFEEPAPASLESSRIPLGARVLIVGEDSGGGDDLRATLAEIGLVVELVATTSRASERMAAQTFDAIVLAVEGGDARVFVSSLRATARVANIPVLFLSSRPTSRDVVDAFASGGDDFLPKPFRTPELAARIFGLLRRARLASGGGAR